MEDRIGIKKWVRRRRLGRLTPCRYAAIGHLSGLVCEPPQLTENFGFLGRELILGEDPLVAKRGKPSQLFNDVE